MSFPQAFIDLMKEQADLGQEKYGDLYKSGYKEYPDGPLWEVVSKMRRYKNKNNPTDLVKAALILGLYWEVFHGTSPTTIAFNNILDTAEVAAGLRKDRVAGAPMRSQAQCPDCKAVFVTTQQKMDHRC